MLGFVDGIALGCVLGTADGCALGLPLGMVDGWEDGAFEGCVLGIAELLGALLGADDGSIDTRNVSKVEFVTVLPVAAAALSSKATADAVVLTQTQLSTQVISVVTVAWDSIVPSCNLRSASRLPPFVPMFNIFTDSVFRRKS